jgi:wyosine [tRNA(Phe)-imidazoG37] synthetase (radical SAM superfamily)
MNIIPLQRGIIYGPVNSRRLGRSLGINLSPTTYKICSFNCVYCQYGETATYSPVNKDIPSAEEVLKAVEKSLKNMKGKYDVVTFSGNGEPTLHPEFYEIVCGVRELTDRISGTPLAVLSNSSTVNIPEVRKALKKIDLKVMKLDAGDEITFMRINRPHGIRFNDIIEGLYLLDDIILQTLLFKGRFSNYSEEHISNYIEVVRYIRPNEIQIYSLDRGTAIGGLKEIKPEELERVARRIESETGIKTRAYYRKRE